MSEELQAKGYVKHGLIVGDFEYLNLGATNLSQLTKAKYIPQKDYLEYAVRKPDRLVIKRGDEGKAIVLAVIEDKQSGFLSNDKLRLDAIQQCNDLAQELNAKVGVITDGNEYIWINPQQEDEHNRYLDKTTGRPRSYSYVTNSDGTFVQDEFVINQKTDEKNPEKFDADTEVTYRLLKEIEAKLTENNSALIEGKKIDPLPLARRVWQDIWIATGKSPEKCLYNVVELFIFKFLSDLDVLKAPYNFETLLSLSLKDNTKKGSDNVLRYYTKNSREEIVKLFPHSSEDNTTIINGTIFVDERGEPNLSQSILFVNSLRKFKDFEDDYGKFTNIDKDFKTKLYESFLKQTAGLKSLGQFFTPRKVIQSIIKMSDIDKLSNGQRFCDPFCGVGGFVLEPLNLYKSRLTDFVPSGGKINPRIDYFGFDKGFEKDEERTIILAKANMLIYLSEIISKYSNLTQEFSRVFNETFRLWKTNLGTLEKIYDNEEDKFDLILTNPPYVTSGKKTISNEIDQDIKLKNFYSINATGVEGLCLEWIVNNLKRNGKAIVVIPDGILNRKNDAKLRKFLLDQCYLEAIVSLPQKTFFATPKKTYILVITKKNQPYVDKQTHPVFTYLVSHIGETLDVNRFDTEENDLKEMVMMFNQFKGIKNLSDVKTVLSNQSKRCKIQDISFFEPHKNWKVDRLWTHEEKVELGIEEQIEVVTISKFIDSLEQSKSEIDDSVSTLKQIQQENEKQKTTHKFVELKLDAIIDFSVNTNHSSFTKKFVNEHKGDIPVYSASKDPAEVGYGFVKDGLPSVKYFEDCMTWNIDGSIGKVFIREGRFTLSEKVIPLAIFPQYEKQLNKLFLKFAIENSAKKEDFVFSEKAGKSKLQGLKIQLPVKEDGSFDYEIQRQIAENFQRLELARQEMLDKINDLAKLEIDLSNDEE